MSESKEERGAYFCAIVGTDLGIHHVARLTSHDLLTIGLTPEEVEHIRERNYLKRPFSPLAFREVSGFRDYWSGVGLIENFLFTYRYRPDEVPKEIIRELVNKEKEKMLKKDEVGKRIPFSRGYSCL